MERTADFIGPLLAMSCFAIFLVLAFGSIAWTWVDANRHEKAGCLWALIAFFTWPLGVIAYILLRDREVRL